MQHLSPPHPKINRTPSKRVQLLSVRLNSQIGNINSD